MELEKLKKDDISNFDRARLNEVEVDIRKELAKVRLDIFTDKKLHTGKVKNLKKNLARVMTYKRNLMNQSSN